MTAIKQYLPSIGMVVVATLSVLSTALTDNRLTADEVANIALALLGALGVYIVPRFTSVQWLKPSVAALTAGIQFLVSVWGDGITLNEWVQVALTVIGFLVAWVTNKEVPIYSRANVINPANN